MEKIKIIDEDKCNEILNKYKSPYYYDYQNDCFIDDNQDINLPLNLKTKKNTKNLFNEAREAGTKACNELKKNTSFKKLTKIEKLKKLRDKYNSAFNEQILKPYNKLTKTDNKKDAYNIAKNLDVKVCPYCNINYIYVVEVNEKNQLISRPDFDHFFSKSKHPELQLNLLNLVPSCQICNRTIKKAKEFTEDNNLNPYKLNFDEIMTFDIRFTQNKESNENYKTDEECLLSILESQIPENCFDIIFKSCSGTSKEDRKRAYGNIKDLKLYERYQNHKDIVIDLFKKRKAVCNARLNEISCITDENYDSLYNAMFSEINCNINHTSLGKLKKDIICKYIKIN